MSIVTKLIKEEYSELSHYKSTPTNQVSKKVLRFMKGIKSKLHFMDFENIVEPNIFLPNVETENFENRRKIIYENFKSFETEKFIPESKIHIEFSHILDPVMDTFNYDEDFSEESFLNSRPTNYLILSKPNMGENELAKIISDYYKCVLITPESLIYDEISSDSRAGKCINFNLKNGRAVPAEVFYHLLERRVKSLTAQHRGFVVAGFPLIPNDNFKEDPISNESAIFNVQEIFEEITLVSIKDSVSTMKGSKISLDIENVEEEEQAEEIVDEEPKFIKQTRSPTVTSEKKKIRLPSKDLGNEKLNTFGKFEFAATTNSQLNYLFSIFEQPYVLIYISSENLDAVNKITNYRFNLVSEQENTDVPIEGLPEFSPDHLEGESPPVENIDYKTNVRLPIHFEGSIRHQLQTYKYEVLPTINTKFLRHDIQYFIKVDGRLTPYRMFSSLLQKLRCLGIQPALVPQLLMEDEMEGEYLGEQKPVFTSLDEAFKKLRLKGIPNRMFKLQLSNWGYKCPVAFKNRITQNGTPENAIRFMNKIFFLSDENAVRDFYRNPRSYLLPVKPKPVFKIFVVGPYLSGRTVIARILAHIFNLAYINPRDIEYEYKDQKNEIYLDSIKSKALVEAIQKLTEDRIKDRKEKIRIWQKNLLGILLMEYPELGTEASVDFVERPAQEFISTVSVVSEISQRTKTDLIHELESLNLPLENYGEIQKILENPEKLLDYLPDEFKRPISPPNVYDQIVTDYVEEMIKNVIFPNYDLTPAEISDMIQQAISSYDPEFFEKTGWIIDGFNPDKETFDYFSNVEIPNEIIYIDELNHEKPVLRDRYENQNMNETPEIFDYLQKYHLKTGLDKDLVETGIFGLSGISMSVIIRNMSVFDTYSHVQSYMEYLDNFTSKWDEFKYKLSQKCPHEPIQIDLSQEQSMSDTLDEIIRILENRYRQSAHIFTDEEKEEEKNDFSGVGPFEEGGGEGGGENLFEENRRLGDTNIYCPVAFGNHFVLWKGKEDFAARFQEKVYLMSTREALNAFLLNPYDFTLNHPPISIPPMRIFILGPLGAGKSTIGQLLSRQFGLFHFDFDKQLLGYLNLDTSKILEEFLNANDECKEVEIIKNYLRNESLPQYILDSLIKPLWTSYPYRESGFVLENFPRKMGDVLYLLKNYLIPDIVIELNCEMNFIKERLLKLKIEKWTCDINIEKATEEKNFAEKMEHWEKEYNSRVDKLLDFTIDQRRQQFYHSFPPNPPQSSPVWSSTFLGETEGEAEGEVEEFVEEEIKSFVYDDDQRNEDIENIRSRVLEEFPRPENTKVWETHDEAVARFEQLITSTYNLNQEDLNLLRDTFNVENIDHQIYLNVETIEKLGLRIIKDVEKYKFRNRSIFERVYSISVDTAERLLDQGYYFLSKFGKNCPVQVYEKKNPFQMYLHHENYMTLFPVIHRRNIYFLGGTRALTNFKNDPLKYIENPDYKLPLMPLKMAIVGPERSGKTNLAEKIEKNFGFKVLTRGKAIRYVMKNLRNSKLAKNMEKVLNKGWSLTEEMTANAVLAASFDPICTARGFILVGFPNSVREMKYLEDCDIIPNVFFELKTVWPSCEVTCADIKQGKLAVYSFEFLEHRHKLFQEEQSQLIKYLTDKYQNVITCDQFNKWTTFKNIETTLFLRHFEILHYMKNKNLSEALPLRYLMVTPYEFKKKCGEFKHYCPACLFYKNHLTNGGKYVDKEGLVQFRHNYFWVCPEHYKEFLGTPQKFLPPNNENILPDYLPKESQEPEYNFYEDGICLICFFDTKKLIYGDDDFKTKYSNRYYVFCCKDHMLIFLREPQKYADLKVNFRNKKPLQTKDLPVLGYLEQNTATLLSQCLTEVERKRPVHPCLSIEKSALIYLGLLLKYRNPKTPNKFLEIYGNAMQKYKNRSDEIKKFIEISKRVA